MGTSSDQKLPQSLRRLHLRSTVQESRSLPHSPLQQSTARHPRLRVGISNQTVGEQHHSKLRQRPDVAALNARGQTECKDDFNFPSKLDAFRYKTFSWPPDDSLRETIGRLPEYTEIPEVLDCVLMEFKMTLLDDVAAPTPQELVELRRERCSSLKQQVNDRPGRQEMQDCRSTTRASCARGPCGLGARVKLCAVYRDLARTSY